MENMFYFLNVMQKLVCVHKYLNHVFFSLCRLSKCSLKLESDIKESKRISLH